MINRRIRIVVAALGLFALWPSVRAEAKQVFRFQAEWRQDPTVDCGPQTVLSLVSSQADVGVVSLSYFNIANTCTGEGFQFVTGTGTVDVSGNQTTLFVNGELTASDGRPITIDLELHKLKNLPDSTKGEKMVSATASGEVILGEQDLTGGQASTSASITRSKS
jgi:hypothetical protein